MRNSLAALSGLLLMCSLPALAEEVSQQHAGLTVTANLETAGEAWTDGPVLLMTHGTLAHNRMEIMRSLQGVFKDRGFSSLAINLSLGLSERTGMYDCPTPHTHRHTDALDEIGLWLDWLKGQGVSSVVLLGHSRGGNQTAWFAAERDDPAIRSTLLIAPQTWSEEYAAKDYEQRYKKALGPVLAMAQQKVDSGRADEMLEGVDFIYCADAKASAGAFVSYYRPDPRMDTPHLVTRLRKPVLVVAGSADTVVKGLIEKMEPLAAAAPNVELAVIDDAGHSFRDLYAEDLADIAVTFIEAH
jgi:pimeloyl-ACP methyl ester carboxylesterase